MYIKFTLNKEFSSIPTSAVGRGSDYEYESSGFSPTVGKIFFIL